MERIFQLLLPRANKSMEIIGWQIYGGQFGDHKTKIIMEGDF
jgi:hypothetical protein